MIRLRVLGATELRDADGRELRSVLAQPKRLALLVYLAATPAFHRRDTLLALFWPELDASRAREALNQAVRFLRKELGGSPSSVIVGRGTGEIGVEAGALWCDLRAFREHVENSRHGEALDLYRGDLLPGFFSEQAAGFEEWLDSERTQLRVAAARAAREVAESRERAANYTGAVVAARRAVELAGLDERAVRNLLSLLHRLGDRAGAIHAFEEFVGRLATELEAEPAAETQALVAQIRQRAAVSPLFSPPVSPPAGPLGNRPVSPFADLFASPTDITPTDAGPSNARHALAEGEEGLRIVRELGRGGTATVYLAYDAKHDRNVALKLLHPELTTWIGTERFLREIQITAQLAHPHVLPLIDSGSRDGQPYLVTPYVAGETLRARLERERRLPVADAMRLTGEIAEALDYAHRCGIVHRDVKPENVLLADGHALVADFGIARAIASAESPGVPHPPRRLRPTPTGVALGTHSYMSPEARSGIPVDAQADIFALGCMLVEMLSGKLPESGMSPTALARRHALPSREVARLAAACIDEDPSERPRSAGEVVRRLERLGGVADVPRRRARRARHAALGLLAAASVVATAVFLPRTQTPPAVADVAPAPRPDLAVLYFDDLTPERRLGHIAAGMTEDLIDRLSGVRGLRVVAPNGVRVFRDSTLPIDTVARRLDVGTLVTGSVSSSGPLFRLAVRLVDARTGTELRSHVFQRPMWDLFTVQDSVSTEVSLWLREYLGRQVRLREIQRATGSVAAWQSVHRADELLREAARHDAREPTLLRGADSLLRLAERLDPRWSEPTTRRARVALAQAAPDTARIAAVVTLTDSVLRRLPGDVEALTVRGEARTLLAQLGGTRPDTLLRDAEQDLHRAASARPDLARPWMLLGDVLFAENRFPEAIDAYVAALDADAWLRSARQVYSGLFFATTYSGRYDEAARWCRTARARWPEDPRFVMCPLILLGHRGRGRADAAEAWREARAVDSADARGVFASSWAFRQMMVAAVLARSGMADSARAVVTRTRGSPLAKPGAPLVEAYVATLLGDRAEALRVLESATSSDPRLRIGLARNPWFRPLAGEARFKALAGEP